MLVGAWLYGVVFSIVFELGFGAGVIVAPQKQASGFWRCEFYPATLTEPWKPYGRLDRKFLKSFELDPEVLNPVTGRRLWADMSDAFLDGRFVFLFFESENGVHKLVGLAPWGHYYWLPPRIRPPPRKGV